MLDSEIFKKLKFTQGEQEKEKSWVEKFEAIESYIKEKRFCYEDFSQKNDIQDNRLIFRLEFTTRFHEDHGVPMTSCFLSLYEKISDVIFHPIHSRETLHVLCQNDRLTRNLSESDHEWLQKLMPYSLADAEDKLKISLPIELEVAVLKSLCHQTLLFYFAPDPKFYCWKKGSMQFMPELQESHQIWKLWGKFIDAKENAVDLWDIQAVTAGGVLCQDQQLIDYQDPSTMYPWVATLLTGGAIHCAEDSLKEFLYRLLCMFDWTCIQWPNNVAITVEKMTPQPIFYVKTKENKQNLKTTIEAFIWFRSEGLEYPSNIHKHLDITTRFNILRLHLDKMINDLNQYHLFIYIPDVTFEHKCLGIIENNESIFWNDFRRSFDIKLSHATDIFYHLLGKSWEVWAENLKIKILQEIEIQLTTHQDWFEMNVATKSPVMKIATWQLIHMLKKKRLFIQLDDGSLGMLPESWYRELEKLFALRYQDGTNEDESVLKFSKAHVFHFANDFTVNGDDAFENIRQEILNINGLKPLQPAPTFQFTLRPYQELGLSWLHFLGRAHLGGCLADDMGLGKTIQVLAYLDLKKFESPKNKAFKSLLICPRSLLEHWLQEARKCAPRLKILILRSSEIARLNVFFDYYDVFIISYGLVRMQIQELQRCSFDLLILDEAQLIKNAAAQMTVAVKQLRGDQRLAISGTPIENHMGELFSLFEFLNPGMTYPPLLKTLEEQVQANSEKETALTKFLKNIRPLILRRLKNDVAASLPDKLEQMVTLPMLDQQEAIYISLKEYYQEELAKRGTTLLHDKAFLLEGLLRLRQAACHPLLFEHSISHESNQINKMLSNKCEYLIDKLKILVSANHKAIIFSQFTSMLKLFRKELDILEIPYEYLDGQSQHRMNIVTRFQENDSIPILLAGIKSGGLGLNLTAADYCFILDPWWNPAIEQQAVDRLHRIGQKKTVNIYRIVSQDTVEEKMLLLKEKKQKIADQLMASDHDFLEKLSYEDFQFLFL